MGRRHGMISQKKDLLHIFLMLKVYSLKKKKKKALMNIMI